MNGNFLSPLYVACQDGDLDMVQDLLLSDISLHEINRVESNGSTCLHAACHYNHPEIVKLLLKSGARRTIKNKDEFTPSQQENVSPQIIQLFSRPTDAARDRFFSDSPQQALEWVSTEHYGLADVSRYGMPDDVPLGAKSILEHPIFQSIVGRSQLENYLEEARRSSDVRCLIKAYSSETGFYRALNMALACDTRIPGHRTNEQKYYFYVGPFLHQKTLYEYQYSGSCYRGMSLSKEDFEKNYKVGTKFLIKPFTSTSKNQQVAEFFANANLSSDPSLLSVICVYTIPKIVSMIPRRKLLRPINIALDISSISEFPDEEEVLILPHTTFTIKGIKLSTSDFIEIELTFEL